MNRKLNICSALLQFFVKKLLNYMVISSCYSQCLLVNYRIKNQDFPYFELINFYNTINGRYYYCFYKRFFFIFIIDNINLLFEFITMTYVYKGYTLMIGQILLTLTLIVGCTSACQVFGIRVFYGKHISDPTSKENLVIMFNTREQCNKSYAIAISDISYQKVYSTVTFLNITNKDQSHFVTYVHRCSFFNTPFGVQILYRTVAATQQSLIQQDKEQNFNVLKLVDPFNPNSKINALFLADWGPIQHKSYLPVIEQVRQTVLTKQADMIIVIGDVGYDLETNNCLNYQGYLEILSNSSASAVPILHITGNHEYISKNNLLLYQSSFQLYSLDINNVTGIQLGSFFLAVFDPYSLIYNKLLATNNLRTNTDGYLLNAYMKVLQQGGNKTIISTSHYPFACSGSSGYCTSVKNTLKQFFSAMFQYKVSIYIGAHFHTFQRISPYCRNNTYSLQENDYVFGEDYFVSIVEGVAGNDKDIVEEIAEIKPYTLAYTINETGFGIMKLSPEGAVYNHYSTAGGIHLVDSMRMTKQKIDLNNY